MCVTKLNVFGLYVRNIFVQRQEKQLTQHKTVALKYCTDRVYVLRNFNVSARKMFLQFCITSYFRCALILLFLSYCSDLVLLIVLLLYYYYPICVPIIEPK